jgi:hypothetical protein
MKRCRHKQKQFVFNIDIEVHSRASTFLGKYYSSIYFCPDCNRVGAKIPGRKFFWRKPEKH